MDLLVRSVIGLFPIDSIFAKWHFINRYCIATLLIEEFGAWRLRKGEWGFVVGVFGPVFGGVSLYHLFAMKP